MIPSYPKIYSFGHRVIKDLFTQPVMVQEKIDGSQISFGIIDGELMIRSKGKHLILDAPEKMFNQAVLSIMERDHLLVPGHIYRGEYLNKPKHNVLPYERIPKGNIIIFDIETTPSNFLGPIELERHARSIDLESVPVFQFDQIDDAGAVRGFMDTISCLGGVAIEGVVAKSQVLFGLDKKALMGKYVSEAFKEKHSSKKYRASGKDRIQSLIEQYRTEARWQKAVQAIREAGGLTDSPKDIGQLIKYVNHDVLEECGDEIKEALYKWAWKQISRGLTKGLPEWYKDQLLEKQFEKENTNGM